MKKYMQPAICVFEIKMENALLGGSNVDLGTHQDVVKEEEYTQHTIWNNNQWPCEE